MADAVDLASTYNRLGLALRDSGSDLVAAKEAFLEGLSVAPEDLALLVNGGVAHQVRASRHSHRSFLLLRSILPTMLIATLPAISRNRSLRQTCLFRGGTQWSHDDKRHRNTSQYCANLWTGLVDIVKSTVLPWSAYLERLFFQSHPPPFLGKQNDLKLNGGFSATMKLKVNANSHNTPPCRQRITTHFLA